MSVTILAEISDTKQDDIFVLPYNGKVSHAAPGTEEVPPWTVRQLGCSRDLLLHDALANRETHNCRGIVEVQLFHDVFAVALHCTDADS